MREDSKPALSIRMIESLEEGEALAMRDMELKLKHDYLVALSAVHYASGTQDDFSLTQPVIKQVLSDIIQMAKEGANVTPVLIGMAYYNRVHHLGMPAETNKAT